MLYDFLAFCFGIALYLVAEWLVKQARNRKNDAR